MQHSLMVTRQHLTWISVAMLLSGLFFNRVLMSMGVIGLILTGMTTEKEYISALTHTFRQYKSLIIGLGLLIAIPMLTVLWSTDQDDWWHRCQIKLPLLLLPLAYWTHPCISHKETILIAKLFIGSIVVGSTWTLINYLLATEVINQAYSQGRVMAVPFGADHQRYSWAVLVAVWSTLHLYTYQLLSKSISMVLVGFFIVFLHYLATRTGLCCLYLTLMVYAFSRSRPKQLLWVLLLMLTVPMLAYKLITPFKNKVHYVLYDINQYRKGEVVEGLSDASRFIATEASWSNFLAHPWIGCGYGDIKYVMHEWYDQNVQKAGGAERLLPPSQYLYYIVCCGLFGLIGFPYALYRISKISSMLPNKTVWWAFITSCYFLLLIETPLEVQRGPILFALAICLLTGLHTPSKSTTS